MRLDFTHSPPPFFFYFRQRCRNSTSAENEKWTATGGPGGKEKENKLNVRKEENRRTSAQCSAGRSRVGTWMYSWWLQKKKLPVWNWNIKLLRGGVSRIRRRGTGRRRNASWLCLWNYLRFLTTIRAQSGFSFSQKTTFCIFLLNAVMCFFFVLFFLLICFFLCVYSKRYIYNFNLFI